MIGTNWWATDYALEVALVASETPVLLTCKDCKAEKEENQFWKDASKANGRKSRCITCESKFKAANRKRDRIKITAAARDYRRRNRENYNQYQSTYYARTHVRVRRSKYSVALP